MDRRKSSARLIRRTGVPSWLRRGAIGAGVAVLVLASAACEPPANTSALTVTNLCAHELYVSIGDGYDPRRSDDDYAAGETLLVGQSVTLGTLGSDTTWYVAIETPRSEARLVFKGTSGSVDANLEIAGDMCPDEQDV